MLFSLDIETTGLDRFKDRILCIGVFSKEGGYQVFKTTEEFNQWNQPDFQFICHNGTFDVSFLRYHGADIRKQFAYDTRSISTILCPTPPLARGQSKVYALENLYQVLLGGSAYKLDRTNLETLAFEELSAYNKRDCEITYELFHHILLRFDEKDWNFALSWVMPATKLTLEMSYNGVLIDQDRLRKIQAETEEKLHAVEEELKEITQEARQRFQEDQSAQLRASYDRLALKALVKARDKESCRQRYDRLFARAQSHLKEFNFNSSTQLKWLLHDFYGLDLFNKRSKKETTDEAMLKEHAGKSPVCEVLLRYRELEKLQTSSLPALANHLGGDGRIHPQFTIGGTRTGRLSSSRPNMQNVPRGALRSCIVASPGHSFLICDYAQIEVRILAELANEEELITAFKNGVDCYSIIASRLLKLDCPVADIKRQFPKERNVSKTAGLSIFYGTGAGKLREVLSKELGIHQSVKECGEFIANYRVGFPGIKTLKENLEARLANQNKINTLLGRPTYIHLNEDLYMKALNTVVQGSASDLVVRAFFEIWRGHPFIRPVMIIHDEMVMEIPDERITDNLIQDIEASATLGMERLLQLKTPLKIEYQVSKEWAKP